MFDAIAPRYDLVNRVMTFGLDVRWRRATVDALGLAPGSAVLDLACGTGDLSDLARRRGYRTVGVDLSWGMLAAAHDRGPHAQGDAAHLGLASGSLDGVVCGYALRNFTDLAASLGEAARVLRPGGRIAVLEVAAPPAGRAAGRLPGVVRARGAGHRRACSATATPTATSRARPPTCPRRQRCGASSSTPGSPPSAGVCSAGA